MPAISLHLRPFPFFIFFFNSNLRKLSIGWSHFQPFPPFLVIDSHWQPFTAIYSIVQPFQPCIAMYSHFQPFPAISSHFQLFSVISSQSRFYRFTAFFIFPVIPSHLLQISDIYSHFKQFLAVPAVFRHFKSSPAITKPFQSISGHFFAIASRFHPFLATSRHCRPSQPFLTITRLWISPWYCRGGGSCSPAAATPGAGWSGASRSPGGRWSRGRGQAPFQSSPRRPSPTGEHCLLVITHHPPP